MKSTHELNCVPVVSLPGAEARDSGLSSLLEALADTLIEAVPVISRLEEQANRHRHQHLLAQQRTEALMARHSEHMAQVSQRMVAMEQAINSLVRETARYAEPHARVVQHLEGINFNVEQVRRLVEAVVQKQQELVEDFIERQVTDRIFRHFLEVYFTLRRSSANGNPIPQGDVVAAADAIESILAESGVNLIHPDAGAPFDPREHHPIKVITGRDGQLDGTVAETFFPGLIRGHRVIQQARVAVLKVDGGK